MRDQGTEPLEMDPAMDPEMGPEMDLELDEVAILQRLGMAARPQPALFAAACAERLLPLYGAYAQEHGGDPEALARALDSVWATVLPRYRVDRARLSADVQGLYPDDDDDSDLTAYAQKAAVAVLHALRIAEGGGLQDAVRAARQVAEAAEHAAQAQHPECDPDLAGDQATLAATPVVREAGAAVAMDLAHALTVAHPAEAEMVRALARAGGEELARLATEG